MTRTRRPGIAWLAVAAGAGLAGPGCGEAAPDPRIVGVSPAAAFTDGPVVLRVDVAQVRPAVQLNVRHGGLIADLASLRMSLISEVSGTTNGSQPQSLEIAEWDGADVYWVKTAPALAAGRYALELVDPRGHLTRFSDAFEALGADITAPTMSISPLSPGQIVGADSEVPVRIIADDGPLGTVASVEWAIEWSPDRLDGGSCPPPPPGDDPPNIHEPPRHQLTCDVSLKAPKLNASDPTLQPSVFRATASDAAGNRKDRMIPLQWAKPPLIFSFSDSFGALGGYQPFVVRGQHFLVGSRAFIGDVPIIGGSLGGDRLDDQSIVGWTPPHDRPEELFVEVRSPAGPVSSQSVGTTFEYLPPPRPRDILPAVGPARGGTLVTVRGNDFRTGMVVYVGAKRLTRQPLFRPRLVTPNQLVGCLPPGAVGPASIWTYDPVAGDGELQDAFTYQDDSASPPTIDANCQ